MIDSRHSFIGSVFLTITSGFDGCIILGRFFVVTKSSSSSSSSITTTFVFFFGEFRFTIGFSAFSFDELNKTIVIVKKRTRFSQKVKRTCFVFWLQIYPQDNYFFFYFHLYFFEQMFAVVQLYFVVFYLKLMLQFD